MKIKVNAPLLGRMPGEVLNPGDRHYEEFKIWTENGDRHGGTVIGVFLDESEAPNLPGEGEDGSVDTPVLTDANEEPTAVAGEPTEDQESAPKEDKRKKEYRRNK